MTTEQNTSMALGAQDGPPDTTHFDADVEAALRRIVDPCSIATGVPIDLVDMGLVLGAERTGARAVVRLQLTSNVCMQIGIIEAKIHEEVGAIAGVDEVVVDVDYRAEWLPSMVAPAAQRALRVRRPFPLSVGTINP
ncbi:iron-sulfur cluster assembly protein [Dactylosporangium sp. NPDC051484]|uniref:iron-sulfur cluster assembly protein n=1 Tax=Dactylosporangium sp. NPDC051484 TaxID=3154942 RepID=UPI00344B4C5F